MNRRTKVISRGRRSPEKEETTESEESSRVTDSFENSPYIKSTSTPLKNIWSDPEVINRSPKSVQAEDSLYEESSDDKNHQSYLDIKEHGDKRKFRDEREEEVRRKGRYNRRHFKKIRGDRPEEYTIEKRRETSDSPSSGRRHEESDVTVESKKKKHPLRGEVELPITEILKRAQENTRTKYEKPAPLTELTTDKIYIQGRNGFSARKISRSRDVRGKGKIGTKRDLDIVEGQSCPRIRVALIAQKFWKNTGFVYQGILGGMALMHFIMLHAFFDDSMEFITDHSMICEIYTNIFSFLITTCIVSTFDKFDLARFNMVHLREIYVDYSKTLITLPLYITIFCLHQVSSKTDDQLALVHYYIVNETLWENNTNLEVLMEKLSGWQKISISKDILAVIAWLFVSLGTRDDALLIHLETMQKYTNELATPRQ